MAATVSTFPMFEGAAFARLAGGGRVLMPPGDHGVSARFGWAGDRLRVSWQLEPC